MALSEEDRQRIREEELVRLQAQEEFRLRSRPPQNRVGMLLVWAIVIAALLILWNVLQTRRNESPRSAHNAAMEHSRVAIENARLDSSIADSEVRLREPEARLRHAEDRLRHSTNELERRQGERPTH